MFSEQERLEMLSAACQDLGNVRITAHSGMLIDIAAQVGATALVRSAGKEHVDAEQMAYLNGCEGLPTLLIPSDPATAFISSSQVRALIAVGALDAATKLVPTGVADTARGRENTSPVPLTLGAHNHSAPRYRGRDSASGGRDGFGDTACPRMPVRRSMRPGGDTRTSKPV